MAQAGLDPRLQRYLRANGHADDAELEAIQESVVELIMMGVAAAVDLDLSPRLDPANGTIGSLMFSDDKIESRETREPEVTLPIAETRFKVTAGKHRLP